MDIKILGVDIVSPFTPSLTFYNLQDHFSLPEISDFKPCGKIILVVNNKFGLFLAHLLRKRVSVVDEKSELLLTRPVVRFSAALHQASAPFRPSLEDTPRLLPPDAACRVLPVVYKNIVFWPTCWF